MILDDVPWILAWQHCKESPGVNPAAVRGAESQQLVACSTPDIKRTVLVIVL